MLAECVWNRLSQTCQGRVKRSEMPFEMLPCHSKTPTGWILAGAWAAVSIPGAILASSFIGFAALAQASGITKAQAVFMTGIVWALPAKVVLIGAILSGSSIFGAAFAVALSSIRLTPMVVAIIPELRGPRTRPITLYFLSHFVAVTSWVLAMAKLRDVPVQMRTRYYLGLGGSLVLANMLVVAAVYTIADKLPAEISAALFLLTPMYFLTSLWASAREWATYVAMIFGLVSGPLLHVIVPGFDLLIAGLTGGGVAFAIYQLVEGRARA